MNLLPCTCPSALCEEHGDPRLTNVDRFRYVTRRAEARLCGLIAEAQRMADADPWHEGRAYQDMHDGHTLAVVVRPNGLDYRDIIGTYQGNDAWHDLNEAEALRMLVAHPEEWWSDADDEEAE